MFSKFLFSVVTLLILSNFIPSTLTISKQESAGSTTKDVDGETDASLIDNWIKSGGRKNDTLIPKSGLKPDDDTSQKPQNKSCQCVKYYKCNSVGGNKTKKENTQSNTTTQEKDPQNILGIVDIRRPNSTGTEFKINSGCQHYFEVCCKDIKRDADSQKPQAPEEPKPDAGTVIKNWVHTTCGIRHENGIGFKITGATGGESQFGEFPWTAVVAEDEIVEVDGPNGSKINATKTALLCGGSLIHPSLVLTAAHCVFEIANSPRYKQLKVRLGEWDVATTDEPYPYQDRRVKEVIIHNQLLRKALYNDIALLVLEEQISLAPNVDTICLPPASLTAKDFDGQSCFSSGWGKNNFGAEGRYQEIMKKTEVPIVPRSDCESALRKTRLGPNFILNDSFLCAGGQLGKDTCVGDGGSPLVCRNAMVPNSQQYVQVGIVSWGISCKSTTPAVYVNVLRFVPWILEKMKKRHLDAKFCSVE